MIGYIIKIDNSYLNWQGMIVDQKEYALYLSSQVDANIIAGGHPGAQVLPEEMSSTNSPIKYGSFFTYHNAIGLNDDVRSQ